MSLRVFYCVAIITALFSGLLWLFPQIDLAISHLFYHADRGFLLEYHYSHWHLGFFRDMLIDITYGFITVLCFTLITGLLFKRRFIPISHFTCMFLLLCFSLGPALLVNDLLKNHWGRARPYQVQEFGGDKQFTPAWEISNQCPKNCSFTSGETANVFCYLALIFVVRRKKLIGGIVLAVAALISFERIAQGDHFFSDTILSGLLDYLLIWLIYQVMKKIGDRYAFSHSIKSY